MEYLKGRNSQSKKLSQVLRNHGTFRGSLTLVILSHAVGKESFILGNKTSAIVEMVNQQKKPHY